MQINLGDYIKDPISGLKGIAVARTIWLWGCIRISIQPKNVKDGKPADEVWFDENRLEVIKPCKKETKYLAWKEEVVMPHFDYVKEPPPPPKRSVSTGGPNREKKGSIEG